MADKEIITNGVDVSECCWCDFEPDTEPYCKINDGEDLGCEDNPNCYYKQLKRKEQECEKLYIQLKADEEYYKEEENTLRKIIKNKEERNIDLYKENNKLKQTLTEIKEIAEPYCNACSKFWYGKGKHCKYCNYSKILQKISEVEDGFRY